MHVVSESSTLGARVEGIDLARPLSDNEVAVIRQALGDRGVLCFPGQALDAAGLAAFGARFGALHVNVANAFHEPGHEEVMILSNMVADGRAVGFADAGQDWHTDLSYSHHIALATILHAKRVPMRGGAPLGDTQFRNMHRAYEDLPADIKRRLDSMVALHDFEKFWDMMRARPGSARRELSPDQRKRRPPVPQPLVRVHPITGRKVLYCNPGYAVRIEGLDPAESGRMLDFVFHHQAQDKYLHAHRWTEGDVLMWDDIGTTHNAVADYGPDEARYMLRVQVMAD